MKNNFTLEELKNLCIYYDKQIGEYPEHEFEGKEFYIWLELYAQHHKDKEQNEKE